MIRRVCVCVALLAGCSASAGDADLNVRDDAGASVDSAGTVSDGDVTLGDGSSSVPDLAPTKGAPSKAVYLGGGQDVRRVVSFDGKTFAHDVYIAPTGADNAFGAILVGNGLIVGAADTGIFTSKDGITWAQQPKPTGGDTLHSCAGAFGNGLFVFVAGASSYASSDGTTWKVTQNSAQSAGHWHGMAYGNGHFVAIGDSVRKVSEDGQTWHDFTATPIDTSAIGFGNGLFVVTAADKANTAAVGYSVTSTDGVTWTAPVHTVTQYMTGLTGVAYGGGQFVTSDCCNAFVSKDGTSWTKKGVGFGGGSLAWSGSGFVASSYYANLYTSTDGTAFTKQFSGDGTNTYDATKMAPFLTTVGAGAIY